LRWRLLIIGNGKLKQEIQNDWRQRFGKRLTLLDAVPHKAVSQYLRSLDIFVLPSYGTPMWKEQFGLTLAQAMLAGVACIGSSSGAIPEVMGSGGLVFPERDLDSLTSALKSLLESKDLRTQLGENAREFALQHYTNAVVAEGYLNAFKRFHAVN